VYQDRHGSRGTRCNITGRVWGDRDRIFLQLCVNSQRLWSVQVVIDALIKVACTIIVSERIDIGIDTIAASTACVNR
jgi:hypothetical protein